MPQHLLRGTVFFFFFVNVIYSNACKCTWLPYAQDCVPVAKVALEMLMKLSHTDNGKHNETTAWAERSSGGGALRVCAVAVQNYAVRYVIMQPF